MTQQEIIPSQVTQKPSHRAFIWPWLRTPRAPLANYTEPSSACCTPLLGEVHEWL